MQYKDVTPIIAELVRLKNSIPLEIDVGRYLPDVRKNTHGEAVRSGLKKALRVIEQAPVVEATPRWISVEEKLPDIGEDCALYVRCGDVSFVRTGWRMGNGKWICPSDSLSGYEVTHWMFLPEPPKEDP